MKAIVCAKYGPPDVLELKEVDKPTPTKDEVLVKIHASAVSAADTMMRRGDPYLARLVVGPSKPKRPILGTGFAGEIEAVGGAVSTFAVGDAVFGETGLNFGANAEYVCVSADGVLAGKPDAVTHEEAAPICDGAMTSLNFLRDIAGIQSGQRVLVNGAAGGLGTAAVQLGKYFGADVTGVCSTANHELVESLGAHAVVDYAKEDFTAAGQAYDIIFDTVAKSSFSRCKASLTPEGVYLSPVLGIPIFLQMLWTSRIGRKKARFAATGMRAAPELRALLADITELMDAGKLRTVIDRRYRLPQLAEAHAYVETGHKKGNVVINMT